MDPVPRGEAGPDRRESRDRRAGGSNAARAGGRDVARSVEAFGPRRSRHRDRRRPLDDREDAHGPRVSLTTRSKNRWKKREHPPKRVLSSSVCCLSQLTASLRPLPALKAGALEAFTWMVSPVWGLRAVRAARLRTSKVPKPVRDTLSPFFKASVMASMTASTLA